MEKRREARRRNIASAPEKQTMNAVPEAIHALSAPEISPAEDIDGVMSILEEMDIEATDVDVDVDVIDDDNTIGIDISKREEEDWEEEAVVVVEEAPTTDTSDPVRMYLQEMGNIPLLSREEEVTIAKEIEAGEKLIRQEVFSSPLALRYVLSLAEKLKQEEIEPRYIFGDEEEEAEATGKEDHRVELFLNKMSSLKRLAGEIEKADQLLHKRLTIKEREKAIKKISDAKEKTHAALESVPLGRRHIGVIVEKLKEVGELLENSQRMVRFQEEILHRKATDILALAKSLKSGAQRSGKQPGELSKAQIQKVQNASQVIQDARKDVQKIEADLGISS
jgi:RNA polymerase primary sigma factor